MRTLILSLLQFRISREISKLSHALYLHTSFEFSPLDGTNVRVFQSGLCTSSELETSRGSIRIQHLTGSSHGIESSSSRFPLLEECAHFHYEFAEIGPLQVGSNILFRNSIGLIDQIELCEDLETARQLGSLEDNTNHYLVAVSSQETNRRTGNKSDHKKYCHLIIIAFFRRWMIKRTLEDFQSLDRQLHTCVYDRRYSQLPVIQQRENMRDHDKVSPGE